MGLRGRKSAASLAVSNVLPLRKAASAPAHLTAGQKATWDAVMESSAGNLIAPEAYLVLVEYCRAVADADQVAKMLDNFAPKWAKKADGFKRFERLHAMRKEASARIASLSVKLRLVPSTRILPRGAGRNEARFPQAKPWETDEG